MKKLESHDNSEGENVDDNNWCFLLIFEIHFWFHISASFSKWGVWLWEDGWYQQKATWKLQRQISDTWIDSFVFPPLFLKNSTSVCNFFLFLSLYTKADFDDFVESTVYLVRLTFSSFKRFFYDSILITWKMWKVIGSALYKKSNWFSIQTPR